MVVVVAVVEVVAWWLMVGLVAGGGAGQQPLNYNNTETRNYYVWPEQKRYYILETDPKTGLIGIIILIREVDREYKIIILKMAHIANVALADGVTGPTTLHHALLVVQTEAADTLQLGNSLRQPALYRARVHSRIMSWIGSDHNPRIIFISLLCTIFYWINYYFIRFCL